ncbi:uncharacterized protein LOC114522245 isoform X2 [Dendronephthya gigantea]|uniref:uncharacterized protein LOC114522245 isoform X2 n=1 Tax=Dendronephthya gigantea TaxID=151771 RepID=UPI00106AEA9B|nr:uncharacterized protein LOC114522245 isoform X2 [Dendronephthya gigantea]
MEGFSSNEDANKGTDRYGQCLLEAQKNGYVEWFNPSGSGNRCFYEYFPQLPERPKTWDECLVALRDQMANDVVIRSTASCFNINIKVLRWDGNITEITPFTNIGKTSVFLAYTGIHYFLLIKEEESSSVRSKSGQYFPDQLYFQNYSTSSFDSGKTDGVIKANYKWTEEGNIVQMSSDGENRNKPQEREEASTKVTETQLVDQFSHLSTQNNMAEKYKKERDVALLRIKNLEDEMENLKKQLKYKDLGKDEEDGTRIRKETKISQKIVPKELTGFVNPFNCKVSCGLSVILFVFFVMGLQVCNRRFISKLSEDTVNCSTSLDYFFKNDLLTPGPVGKRFYKLITDDYTVHHALQEAVKTCMPGESYPALLVFHYKKVDGKIRAGHCVAIMPDGVFIDVQKKRYWNPFHLSEPISHIYVVKVDDFFAKLWVIGCLLCDCEYECYRSPDDLN